MDHSMAGYCRFTQPLYGMRVLVNVHDLSLTLANEGALTTDPMISGVAQSTVRHMFGLRRMRIDFEPRTDGVKNKKQRLLGGERGRGGGGGGGAGGGDGV